MLENSREVAILIHQLLSQLSECSDLCDKIVVKSLQNCDAPLPPNLSQIAGKDARLNAAHEWLAQAQEFQGKHTSGALLSKKIVKCQEVIHTLAIGLQAELRSIE